MNETVEMRAVQCAHDWYDWNEYVQACKICDEKRAYYTAPVTKLGDHKDEGKPPLQDLDPRFLVDVATVMAFGAKKYGRFNYQKGIEVTRLAGSVLRHVYAFIRGVDKDEESGLPHLAHAGASLMMLYHNWVTHPSMDDRGKP